MLRSLITLAVLLTCAGVVGAFDSEPAKSSQTDKPAKKESAEEKKPAPSKPAETRANQKGLPRRWRLDDGELPTFTPEREAAAITFARRHHSELADLLEVLAKTNRDEYESAICELFNTSELLAKTNQKDPVRAKHELEAWKIHSRIQLLAARATMDPDGEVLTELEAALQSQIDQRLAAIDAERKALEERLDKLKATREQLKETRDRQVKRQLEMLTGARKAPAAREKAEKTPAESKDKGAESPPKKNAKPAGN